MSKREAVERVVGRMYQHKIKAGGSLPSSKEVREMEKKAIRTAENVDNRTKRK